MEYSTIILQSQLSLKLGDKLVGMTQNQDGSVTYFRLSKGDHSNFKIDKVSISCLTTDEILENFDL